MVNALDSGSRSPVLNPGRGHSVVYWARHFSLALFSRVHTWLRRMLGATERNVEQ